MLNFPPKSVVPKKAITTKETPITKMTNKKSNMRDTLLFTIMGVSNYNEIFLIRSISFSTVKVIVSYNGF